MNVSSSASDRQTQMMHSPDVTTLITLRSYVLSCGTNLSKCLFCLAVIAPCLEAELVQFPLRMRDWLKNVLLQLYEHDSMSPGFLTAKQRFRVCLSYSVIVLHCYQIKSINKTLRHIPPSKKKATSWLCLNHEKQVYYSRFRRSMKVSGAFMPVTILLSSYCRTLRRTTICTFILSTGSLHRWTNILQTGGIGGNILCLFSDPLCNSFMSDLTWLERHLKQATTICLFSQGLEGWIKYSNRPRLKMDVFQTFHPRSSRWFFLELVFLSAVCMRQTVNGLWAVCGQTVWGWSYSNSHVLIEDFQWYFQTL